MKRSSIVCLSLGLLNAAPCLALEPLKSYDTFSTAPINGALWSDGERTMQIKGGVLTMTGRAFGSTASNSGFTYGAWRMRFADASAVTEIKAKVTVTALEVNGCAANVDTVSQSRARINGSFYNFGTPVDGDETGDAIAQVRVTRFANSTDPTGVLQVQGLLVHCLNVDCNVSSVVQNVSLGTVTVGQAATLEIQWDKPNKRFLFTRDAGAFTGTIAYTDNDSHSPGVPFKVLDLRSDFANCIASSPLTGSVNASFDTVSVNRSAAP